MSPDALRKQVGTVGKLALGLFALLAVVMALHSAVLTEWFLAFSAIIVIWYYTDIYRTFLAGRWTLFWYYRVVNGTLIALVMTVGTLLAFMLAQGIHDHSVGWFSLGLLATIAVHQAYRGCRLALNGWHSAEDVINSLLSIDHSKAPLPKIYDASFFGIVSIGASLLGHIAGYSVELMLSAILLTLGIPFMLAMVVTSHILLRRFFPEDAPYPRPAGPTGLAWGPGKRS